jgi:AraC-like DNA-binding protein
MAPLTDDDRVLIRILRTDKGWNSYQMIKEFPNRGWNRNTLNRIICQIDNTGTWTRKRYERQCTARTPANIARVAELICSQEDDPGTSKSPREIERETGISRRTVQRIAKDNLNLKIFRRREVQQLSDADTVKRLNACKRLKKRMTVDKIERTWFSDEKIFTVQTPTNTQNDRVYAAVNTKRDVAPARLLKGRKHFSQSVMVSVAVSKLGKTDPFFVTPRAKINSAYYCEEVLKRGLLPDIRRHSGDNFIFQQDGAPAHRSLHTVAFLTVNVPEFIEPANWPPNSPDLNPVDYSIWGYLQQLVYRQKIQNLDHLKRVIVSCWSDVSQHHIDGAIDQWSRRIAAVVSAKGGHIEYTFD